ncbi:hypothetical protein K1X12_04520 [Hyphomonas sp. WL0036]|uniref:hypothetical protein n=1 Tax=Hyphomonas sediminis TaxID=2866160 RepID=UPI001C7F025E|nr:hypothetical protein [Hyphomonas sediminis]MBY9066150.1 hypothetical protein [Hyphomonas sediminis]
MTRSPTLAEDLSYIRDLAESGQNAPLLGGRFLAMWGGLVTAAYIGHYLISAGVFGENGAAYLYMWLAFGILGGLGQFLMVSRMGPKPGQASAGNRVQTVLWTTAGLFLFVYFVSLMARVMLTGEGVEGFYWSVPMVLGLYGIGQFVTGAISGQGALKFAGIAAFAGVAATVFMTGTEYIWLAGAGAAFLAVCVPGIMMMRAEPSDTV